MSKVAVGLLLFQNLHSQHPTYSSRPTHCALRAPAFLADVHHGPWWSYVDVMSTIGGNQPNQLGPRSSDFANLLGVSGVPSSKVGLTGLCGPCWSVSLTFDEENAENPRVI